MTAARWRRARYGVGAVVAAGVTAGVLLAPGFDEREVPPVNPSVWALQTTAGQHYGRINTDLDDMDTVKVVEAPSQIFQNGANLVVLSANLSAITPLAAALPVDIEIGTDGSEPTPAGTSDVVHAGDVVGFLTDSGEVFAGRMSTGAVAVPARIDPFADVKVAEGEDLPQFRATALAVGQDGTVVAYSAAVGQVLVGSVDGGVSELFGLQGGPDGSEVEMAVTANGWVLFDPDSGKAWLAGQAEPLSTGGSEGARLQVSCDSDLVYVADDRGLITVGSEGAVRVFGGEASIGVPAAPSCVDGKMVGAWLPQGEGQGTLWWQDGPVVSLSYGAEALPEQRRPEFRSNGTRVILNESRSGWVWDVPSGALVAASQAWTTDGETQIEQVDDEVVSEVTEPRPPVAEPDAFGVRAGRQVLLPVLLNDHDANGDVLTIDPASMPELPADFGSVSLADDGQALVATIADGAQGSVSVDYVVSDGTTDGGRLSEPATVTLTVHGDDVNGAPEWCPVEHCTAVWPTPQVQPGGTVSLDVLSDWVDPDGDPIYVSRAASTDPVGSVAASPDGLLVFQHSDPSGSGGSVGVDVTVSDIYGLDNTKTLMFSVVGEPRLKVEGAAMTTTVNTRLTVPISDNVTGARGPVRVVEVAVDVEDGTEVAPTQTDPGFTFMADQPGTYQVSFTVTDGVAQARGSARVTVIAAEDAQLSTVPLMAFVHAKEDATIDVLAAVTNPSGRVLLISSAEVIPAEGVLMSADVIGHSALRLSGSRVDGSPGELGTVRYAVSDGSGDPHATAVGEVTVVLLESEIPSPPLAVDDAITVRAGSQANLSVLANDVAAAGSVVALDPESVVIADGDGLAFAAGTLLRYLAPSTPGVYTISYDAYVLGYPAQRDVARVVVTVLDDPQNTAPRPADVSGRVASGIAFEPLASGDTVRIPFVGTAIDPDGDAVVLDRIETNPDHGAASISADGTSLVYLSTQGYFGQDVFTFSVIDARGEHAVATARIGVIDVAANPSPVTFTDVIQVQAGATAQVNVSPLANDIDLTGGTLELLDVVPDAALGTTDYVAFADRIVAVVDNSVLLRVPDEPGTATYLYTVQTDTGSTAVGRIVVKAVRERVLDVPVVVDTILTYDARASFSAGIDVLAGKVSWAGGDPTSLTLTLWGAQPTLSVTGSSIRGPISDAALLVPFQVTGIDYSGVEVTSYGFLRIPGEDDFRVTLNDKAPVVSVKEKESVTVDLLDLVSIPDGAELIVEPESVRAGGGRGSAVCESVGGTSFRYVAGQGEPFSDTCLVGARLSTQDQVTLVPVPIAIIAADPLPTLEPRALEVQPGATQEIDLAKMVTWPAGSKTRPVEIAFAYSGNLFTVERTGNTLTVYGKDNSTPGLHEAITVSLTSDKEVASASVSLEVGPAPDQLPRAASIVEKCSQAGGNSSCVLTVVGRAGEVNPLPNTPMVLVGVTAAEDCRGVTFAALNATQVKVSWTPEATGGVCDAIFTLKDAQGRVTAGDKVGVLSLDLQGIPFAPAAVSQVGFGDGTLTLAVDPGQARNSYPAISGFHIMRGGAEVASCDAGGACGQITGRTNGVKDEYTALAYSEVGNSKTSVMTTAWSYAPPAAVTNVNWAPTVTTGAGKQFDLTFTVTDPTTRAVRLTTATGVTRELPVSGTGPVSFSKIEVDTNTQVQVSLVALSGLQLPAIPGAAAEGGVVQFGANGIGAPAITAVSQSGEAADTTATIRVSVTSGGDGSTTDVGVMNGGRCDTKATGDGVVFIEVAIPRHDRATYDVCAVSHANSLEYGASETKRVRVFWFSDPGAPVMTMGYVVGTTCAPAGAVPCEPSITEPVWNSAGVPREFDLWFSRGSIMSEAWADVAPRGEPAAIEALYCLTYGDGQQVCSSQTTEVTTAGPGYAPKIAAAMCHGSLAGGPSWSVNVTAQTSDHATTAKLYDANGVETTDLALMRSIIATVTFKNALSGIDAWTSQSIACDGIPPRHGPEEGCRPSAGGGAFRQRRGERNSHAHCVFRCLAGKQSGPHQSISHDCFRR